MVALFFKLKQMENKMKYLSLSWFKSKIEKGVETAIEKVVTKKVENLVEELSNQEVLIKPYHSSIQVNDTLTVVLNNGQVLTKQNVEIEKLGECKTEDDVIKLMSTKELVQEKEKQEEVKKEIELIVSNFDILVQTGDFEVKDNSVYLKGINRSVPKLLVNRFAEVVGSINTLKSLGGYTIEIENFENEYLGLKRFFLWCCCNPRAEVADKLYDFLEENGMKITKQGLFVALRNVVKKDECNHELVDFISNAYNKVKTVWKKKSSNFWVHCNMDNGLPHSYSINQNQYSEFNDLGNLEELYLNLPNMKENVYTDNYTKTFTIKIGQKVSMNPEECDWSTQDCATAGLHFAGHTAPYVLCGDTTVFTLHNPMKVVGIGTEKGRCWEYLPFMTTDINEANEIMSSHDFDFLELDEQYAIDELQDLEDKIKQGFATEVKKYDFNLPALTKEEITTICKSLTDIQEELKSRVVNI